MSREFTTETVSLSLLFLTVSKHNPEIVEKCNRKYESRYDVQSVQSTDGKLML